MRILNASAALTLVVLLAACQPTQSPKPTEPAAPSAPVKPEAFLSDEELIALADDARAAVTTLGAQLKAELISGIQTNGPVGAVSICKDVAQDIATRVSEETGLEVGRTARKVRNPLNAPDAWELESLDRFETSHANNFPYDEIERFYVVEEDGKHVFRYMKPIEMGDVCATCHGSDIAEDVKSAIDLAYPEDQATGFEPGDLRGAFTVRKVLD